MTMIICDVGDRRKLTCSIADESGAAADPDALTFKIKTPDGTLTTYVYGSDGELVKDAVGSYHVYWDCAVAGDYWFRFEATGTVMCAEEAEFFVQRSHV